MSKELEQIQSEIQQGNISSGLQVLADSLQNQKRYSEWFEALKMQARHDLGLEIWSQGDDSQLPIDVARQLEDRLVDACRIVGEAMIANGLIREGWMYLRPVGDPLRARELLLQQPINDETLDSLIEVAIGHGVHPAWGYQLLLDRMGTCNAISTYDSQMQTAPLAQRQQAAAALVKQLYHELVVGIQHAISDSDSEKATEEFPLGKILQANPNLCHEGGYHVDASHLSSTVRIARIVDDPISQRRALELCEYGMKLDASLQPEGHVPFDPYFDSHRMYFQVLLGQDPTQKCIAFFRKQRFIATTEVDKPGYHFGLEEQFEATETLVELLIRTGQFKEATTVLLEQLQRSSEHQTSRWSAALFDCCRRSGDFSSLRSYGLQKSDMLGFTLASIYTQLRESNQVASIE